ncbi:MAG: hypothetical protein IPO38_13295 [Rhodocyclaceae bacterium]|nr:hypothetical protein [Rhodocyclaceae bacterium]
MVCNHISFIDIFVINSVLPSPFVAKAISLAIYWLAGGAPTPNSFSAVAKLRRIKRNSGLPRGWRRRTIRDFPEASTTSSGAQVLPFHAALFQKRAGFRRAVALPKLELSRCQRCTRRSASISWRNDSVALHV